MNKLLEIENLKTYFRIDEGIVKAVDGVSFDIEETEILSLVGESGCGKTVTALSIMSLIQPPGQIVDGRIIFKGEDTLKISAEQMRRIRGRDMAMVFQEPMSSLNPVYRIESQIGETIRVHLGLTSKQIKNRVIELLEKVEIRFPQRIIRNYPYQLSGGMRQRVMIAMALACNPKLLIADEPTSALDVTIQAQILRLFYKLNKEIKMSILLITHDLGIVAEIADRVAIMYAGRIVEVGNVRQIFQCPKHPYTEGLLCSIPNLEVAKKRLSAIPGSVPDPADRPDGCSFNPRCNKSDLRCRNGFPPAVEVETSHIVNCWKAA